MNGQKFKAHTVILSASSVFFKKLLVNNFNHHPLIFTRKMKNKRHYNNLHWKKKLERNQVESFVIFITKIELFRYNERIIEVAR